MRVLKESLIRRGLLEGIITANEGASHWGSNWQVYLAAMLVGLLTLGWGFTDAALYAGQYEIDD